MDKNIEREKKSKNSSKTFPFQVISVHDFESIEIRHTSLLKKSTQNKISAEQFDKAGQQISNIRGAVNRYRILEVAI